ncbi:MAG: hypothetical protein ACRBBS_08675 [Thalassovita sp.]
MFHMQEPTTEHGLTFRKVYHGPFWAIEKTNERWNWRVAQKSFAPEKIDPDKAKSFHSRWQKRMFKGATEDVSQDGFVYVPLQGNLTERRSFQMASPIEMLMAVLHNEPNKRVIATLHPNETYAREEQRRLLHMQDRFANLSIQTGGMVQHLQRCNYVVTQNSAAAFHGFFFGKPCVLFGKIDFHHIALNVETLGVANAFEQVQDHQPDYQRYIYWFWQNNCINSGRAFADKQIAKALRREGWPV